MQIDHYSFRKKRTRTLIQMGGLIEKAGLASLFGVTQGDDLQQDPDMKIPAAALMGALLELENLIRQESWPPALLAEKGMKFMASAKGEEL